MVSLNDKEFKQVLIGSLLGDGNIRKSSNKSADDRFIFCENHSIKQKNYLLKKIDILKTCLDIKSKEYTFLDKRSNTISHQFMAWSKKSFLLKELYDIYYKNNKKVITPYILDKLSPLGITVWYMDDGNYSYDYKNIVLSTEAYTLQENKLIQSYFKDIYNINFILTPRHESNYRLRLNVVDTKKFIQLIKPHIFNSMDYKLGENKEKIKISKNRLKNYRTKYYQKNKINLKKQVIENYYKNKDKILEHKREHRQDNINLFLKRENEYRIENRNKLRIYNNNYYHNNIKRLNK